MRIAVLITCHNRRDKTLICLRALFASELLAEVELHVILVDDGSTDKTAQFVAHEFPQVEILFGDGNLFWNRGMHRAFARAMEVGFDGYLWLNDDTVLYPKTVERLVSTANRLSKGQNQFCIVVGATEDDQGTLTYGGSIAVNRLQRFKFRKVWNADQPVECEAMNGNCVLIPHEVAKKIGNIDPEFEHAMGDIDYSLRARSAGFRVFSAPGFVGRCTANPIAHTFQDRSLGLKERWKFITSRKGVPVKSWYRFTRRHGGLFWPMYFVSPYLKQLLPR